MELLNSIKNFTYPELKSDKYELITSIRKGVIEGTKTVVISAGAILSIAKVLNRDISIEDATTISIIIGGICGGIKAAMNWHKNRNKGKNI